MKKLLFGPASSAFFLLLVVIGTAKTADGVSVGAVFDVSGLKGSITFRQLSPGAQTNITLTLIGLAQFPEQTFDWKILSTPVASLPQSCRRLALDGNPVYDPLNSTATLGDSYAEECMRNQSVCAVGDMSGKHGELNSSVQSVTFVDRSVALFGGRSVIGRVVVVYLPGDVLACANIAYPESGVNAVAPFRNIQNMYLGNIWFREVVLPRTSSDMDQTAVFADLVTTSTNVNSLGHNWHVHDNPVGNGSMCGAAGPHYDPEGKFQVANYSYFCSPLNQSACEIGDLSGKSSPLDFSNGTSQLFYHDINLPLEGNSEGFSILNRSVVVHERNSGPARLACADIGVLPRRQAIASFDVEGVVGHILFVQATPFDSTNVRVLLEGLEQNAEGYHVHETPVGATQTDCGAAITGGHFDPWMVGGFPTGNFTTSDDYEAGDLSGKFGQLSNLSFINVSVTDPFIPLFGRDSIIGRSIVIHRPGGARWVCANVTHLQPTVTLVATFNSSEVQGQVVFTQLREDPLSEAAIFVEFVQVAVPVVTPSASSMPSVVPTSSPVTLSSLSRSPDTQTMSPSSGSVTLSSMSTSPDAQTMSPSSGFVTLSSVSTSPGTQTMSPSSGSVAPSVTSATLEMAATMERVAATSATPTPITSSTTTAIVQAIPTSISEETMTLSTILLSSSSEQPRLSLFPSSTVDGTETPSPTPSPPPSSTVVPTLSTSYDDRLIPETTSSLGSTLEPTPSMTPVGRRKREDEDHSTESERANVLSSSRHRRQSLPTISWSIRASCNSAVPVPPPECGPGNPLTCSPGDLDGKHGQLQAAGPLRRVFTDPFLPLSGNRSVEGSVLVLELGPNMMVCASIVPQSPTPMAPSTVPPTSLPTTPLTTSPAAPPTTSPAAPPTTSPTAPPTTLPTAPPALPVITLPVIIGVVVVCVCLVVVLVVAVILVICLCYCCWRRRRNKFSLWEEDESRRNGNHYSSDVEMEHIRFSPSSSQKYVQTYRVVMDYEPSLVDHLPLKTGETLVVLEREREGSATPTSSLGEAEGRGDELWKGKIGDAVGWFPARNVERVHLDEMNLSEDEREEAVKQLNIDRAAEAIIAASKSFSVQKPAEVQPDRKKAQRSRSFGANIGISTNSRNSPASSVSPGRANESKLKELPRGRSTVTPLPWITVHNLTKDKIDSTPVSLKKLDQVGKHNSYVSDDINVVLEDIPQPSASPVASAALASAGSESMWQDDVVHKRADKSDAAITSYEYRASFAYDGDHPDDLLFKEGDIVNVTWAEDTGWWYGTTGTRVGWFPGSFVEPVDMSASEDDEDEDEGFLSDPPVDAPLDLDHVEIDIGKTPADNIDALAVDNITVELQVDDKESKFQRTIEPLSSSSPIPAKPEVDPTGTAVGNFTAEIMGLFAAKNVDQTSTQEGLAREQPQAPSPEDGKQEDQTDKDVSQRGMVEGASPSSRLPPPTASPRKKLRKADKEQKRQPQRRAPPPPPAGAKVKETSNAELDQQTTIATQPDTPTDNGAAQPEPTALKPKRKPPAVPAGKKVEETTSSSSTHTAVGQEKVTQPVQIRRQEQIDGGKDKEPAKAVSVPRRRAPGVPTGRRKPHSHMPNEGGERARPARPPQQLRRMRPIPPPPSMPCPPPPIKPRTKLQQKQHSSSDDQLSEPRKEAISSSAASSVAPVPAERKKASTSISAILQAAVEGDDTDTKAETREAPPAANPPVVAARQPLNKEDSVAVPLPAATDEAKQPPRKLPKPPVLPKTKAAVNAWHRISSSSLTEEIELGAEGSDGASTQRTKTGTVAMAAGKQEGGKGQGGKPALAPKPKPPARFSSLSDAVETSTDPTDANNTRKEANKPESAPLEAIAEKNAAGVVKPSHSPPLPRPREPGSTDGEEIVEGSKKPTATAEPNKREEVADKGRRLSQTGEKPAVPKKPDSLVKATRRQPPAPPPGSPISVPQRRGSPLTVRKYKPPRPLQVPKLAKQTTAESTTSDGVEVPPGSQQSVAALGRPSSAKEKPARPPPPTFTAQPRNVPNTSTFFLGTVPTPAPRKNISKPADAAPEVEGEGRGDADLRSLKRVISPYTARHPDELTIRMGDSISELEPPNSTGMCYGMLDNGQTGLYPSDCVENW